MCALEARRSRLSVRPRRWLPVGSTIWPRHKLRFIQTFQRTTLRGMNTIAAPGQKGLPAVSRILIPVQLGAKESVERAQWVVDTFAPRGADIHICYALMGPARHSTQQLEKAHATMRKRFAAVQRQLEITYHVLPVVQSYASYADPAASIAAAICARAWRLQCSVIVISGSRGVRKLRDNPVAGFLVGHSVRHYLALASRVPLYTKQNGNSAGTANSCAVPLLSDSTWDDTSCHASAAA